MSFVGNSPTISLHPIGPLVVAIKPYPDESLAGMVARSTRLNVLGRTNVILEEVGLTLLHPGAIGQELGDLAPRLAQKIGCSVRDVEERCHPYIGAVRTGAVKFGSGAIHRPYLELESRRCSPASLKIHAYHRASWMCRLLPYCPESLERLIDKCADCEARLGWRKACGLDRCDVCGVHLRHPDQKMLPDQLVSDYRTFAELVSADNAVRGEALSRLHPDVAALPATVLTHLILALGTTCRSDRIQMKRPVVLGLEPSILADVVARGAFLIQEWPNRLRNEVRAEMERAGLDNGIHHRSFRTALRKLGLIQNARPEQIAVVRAALPEVFEDARMALGGLVKPIITGAKVCRMAAINAYQLADLRDAGLIEHFMTVKKTRTVAQYDQLFAAEFAHRKRGSERASRLEQYLGIPRYACEQLACVGEISREDHPAVTYLDSVLRFVSHEAKTFCDELEGNAQNGRADSAIPLGVGMRLIGGRMKPWAAVLGAMRRGEIPYWLSGTGQLTRKATVQIQDIERFQKLAFQETEWPDFPFATEISMVDTMDILNVDHPTIQRLVQAGELNFWSQGVALVTDRPRVLALAGRWIGASELALILGINARSVWRMMSEAPDITRHVAGWDREACIKFAKSRLGS